MVHRVSAAPKTPEPQQLPRRRAAQPGSQTDSDIQAAATGTITDSGAQPACLPGSASH